MAKVPFLHLGKNHKKWARHEHMYTAIDMSMRALKFPDWVSALANSALEAKQKESYLITIRWFLSFCRQGGNRVDFESARAFVACAEAEKKPGEWVMEQWKAAIRWFFKNGEQGEVSEGSGGSSVVGNDAQGFDGAAFRKGEARWRNEFIRVLRIRQFGYSTEKAYAGWLERFANYNGRNDLEELGEKEIKLFLDHLAVNEDVAAPTQRQALNALVFLYREVYRRELGDFSDYKKGHQKKRVRVVLSEVELCKLFACLNERYQLMAKFQYGTGMRVTELVRLRVKDVDFERGQVLVRSGKGDKDRVTLLPESLVPLLKDHLNNIRSFHASDREKGIAGVYLPPALERKYKTAGEQWPWFWFWPARTLSGDPRAGGLVRRHHVVKKTYQHAVTRAVREAALSKAVCTHAFRNAYS